MYQLLTVLLVNRYELSNEDDGRSGSLKENISAIIFTYIILRFHPNYTTHRQKLQERALPHSIILQTDQPCKAFFCKTLPNP